MPPVFGPGLRQYFLLEEGAVYLNHGSYGATPKSVMLAQRRWQERMEREPSRFMDREFRPGLRVAAERLSAVLGVTSGREIALVENATQAVNAVLDSLSFAPGDEILISDQTYNAVRNAALHVAGRTSAVVRSVDLPFPVQSSAQIVQAYAEGLGPKTRLAIIDHVTSPTALVLPVRDLVRAAKQAGALALVDGAHAPGMVELDLPVIGADFYTGNCHKWLFAPKGCAFLWADAEQRAALHPRVISHGYGDGFIAEFDWVGTRDASAQHALPDAIDFLDRFGDQDIREHNHALAVRAAHRLAEVWDTGIGGPDALLGAMAAIRLPSGLGNDDRAAIELRRRLLDEYRIQAPIRAWGRDLWVRISAQIYNDLGEYEKLGQAVLTERRNAS